MLIFLYNVDLSVAGCWVEGTIKKKRKEEEKEKDWQAFCYAMRSNPVQLLMSGGVGTSTIFYPIFFTPPPPQHLTVFVCLFVCFLTAAYCFSETPLTFLKLHGSMSQMVSIDQHFIPFGSENER